MPKYLSGRVKLRNQSDLSVDRYKYLALDEAEPNLGFPPDGGSPDIPSGAQYQVISVINDDSEVKDDGEVNDEDGDGEVKDDD